MINDASVVIGGGNWGIKEADVLGYKLINDEYYARDIDFANSTAAGTYTDSTGVVRKAPYNLLQQSNTFNVTWGTAFATVTIGQPGYDGTNNAWLFSKSLADGRISQPITLTSGAYTYSVYAKAGTKNWVFLRTDGTSNRTAYFNLQTGVTGTATGCTSSISSVGDGWYRCSITFTDSITIARVYVADANNDTSGTSGDILIQAAQLVEGTEALPYFPTTTRLNVPRIDYRNADGSLSTTGRLLLEPQRTNSIRNSSMVGAVAGTPGTLPTNWINLNTAGLTRSVVAVGTENGLPYIDVRLNGTATGVGNSFSSETPSGISASSNQVWANSAYIKVIEQPNPPVAYRLQSLYANGGSYVGESITTYTPTTTLTRFNAIHTAPASTITNIYQGFSFALTIGQTYDFTIRIAAPQMELGAYATTWIPTTTATVTRNADAASRTGVSSWIGQTDGTLFVDFNYYPGQNMGRLISVTESAIPVNNRLIINVNSSNNRVSVISRQNNTILNGSIGESVLTQISAGRNKIALGYQSGNSVLYINGVQVGTNADSFTFPVALNRLFTMTSELSLVAENLGYVNQAAIFTTRLTNSQLQSLTTL